MLNQIYDTFESLNLNPTTLLISVVVFSLFWALATREILSWFMKTNEISKQFKLLHQRLDTIETQIKALKTETPIGVIPPQPATKKLFEFHH